MNDTQFKNKFRIHYFRRFLIFKMRDNRVKKKKFATLKIYKCVDDDNSVRCSSGPMQ